MVHKSRVIRVVVIEKQKVIREGLKLLLESETDIKIVGSFSNNLEVIAEITKLKPDIVLISADLSEDKKFDFIQEIQQVLEQIKIIVFCNEVAASDFVQYLELGVKGCLLKTVSTGKIKEIVRYVDQGYTHIEEAIFQTVLPEISNAISAISISNTEFRDSLISIDSEDVLDDKFQLYALGYSNNSSSTNDNSHSLLNTPLLDDVPTVNYLSENNLEKPHSASFWHNLVSKLVLAGLGFAAIAFGISAYRQENPIVIKDAVINGELVSVNSSVSGKLQKIIYLQGVHLQANEVFALVELAEDSQISNTISQLEKDFNLKQEQIDNAKEFLSFLQRQLNNIPKSNEIAINLPSAEENTTISIDNSREIANLEQQIFNQQSTINFLGKELSNLQGKLDNAKASYQKKKIIPIKAPIAGTIYNINYNKGESIKLDQEIATFLNCQNIWVEAIIDSKTAAKINLQKDVSVQLANQGSLISGKVKLIENLSDSSPATNTNSIALTSNVLINNRIVRGFSRVIIDADFPESEAMLQDYCNVGLSAEISINK